MITTPLFYVMCADEGAYLSASRGFWIRPFDRRNPGGYTPKSIGLWPRDKALAILGSPINAEQRPKSRKIELRLAARCTCCGKDEFRTQLLDPTAGPWRCMDHRERNPCAIEGCRRTTAAPENSELPDPDGRLRNDQWLCPEHWRKFVPPRSRRRRAYNRFFRLAKRDGWTPDLDRQFWRFWNTLVVNARHKAEHGTINVAEIERLFG